MRNAVLLFTAIFLAIYLPVETYVSLPDLLSPFYVVDLIGIVLLAVGLLRYWRDSQTAAAALLVAGFSWTGANFWRGMADRLRMAELQQEGWTQDDSVRIALVGGLLICVAAFGMVLALRAAAGQQNDRVARSI